MGLIYLGPHLSMAQGVGGSGKGGISALAPRMVHWALLAMHSQGLPSSALVELWLLCYGSGVLC